MKTKFIEIEKRNKTFMITKYFMIFVLLFAATNGNNKLLSQKKNEQFKVLDDKIKIVPDEFSKNIQVFNVDISNFPEIDLILKVSPNYLFRVKDKNLKLYQNGKPMPIISVDKATYRNKIPVDIILVMDKTGSMIDYIDKVKANIQNFVKSLVMKGIDYRVGVVTFSDIVDSVYEFTGNIEELERNLKDIKSIGGGDKNENALEALYAAYKYSFRPDAKKLIMLFTDALFHYRGFNGDGKTDLTLDEVIEMLRQKNISTYTIVPLIYDQYKQLSRMTGGKTYNLVDNFNSMLETFSDEISQFYTLKYLYKEDFINDSMYVDVFDQPKNEYIISRKVNFLDINKVMVISNDILFDFNKSEIKPVYYKNLKNLTKFLKLRNSIEISINGHTDNIGSDSYNLGLSLARANSVMNFLIKNGISANRLSVNGYGKTHPISPNDTEEGRQLNRRIEIIITKK